MEQEPKAKPGKKTTEPGTIQRTRELSQFSFAELFAHSIVFVLQDFIFLGGERILPHACPVRVIGGKGRLLRLSIEFLF